jgi:hypothetical protein
VDAAFIAAMPDRALLVNAARGEVVDTEALVAELTSGRLRAALDLTNPEPLPPAHPLFSAPNLLLTPHVCGAVSGAVQRAFAVAAEQVAAFVRGEKPPNRVEDEYGRISSHAADLQSTVNLFLTCGSAAYRHAASVHSPWAVRSSSGRCLVVVGVLGVVGLSKVPAGHRAATAEPPWTRPPRRGCLPRRGSGVPVSIG